MVDELVRLQLSKAPVSIVELLSCSGLFSQILIWYWSSSGIQIKSFKIQISAYPNVKPYINNANNHHDLLLCQLLRK